MSNQTRTYRVMLTDKKTGTVTYTSVSVESPSGQEAARRLAESMYGSTHNVSILA